MIRFRGIVTDAGTALLPVRCRSRQEIFPDEEQTPAALTALQRADIAKRWPLIKAAGIKAK